ncbi:AMP-dependent synthetase and ligase domain protein, partial [Candidatus Magnetomorum sp. HK-1]
GVQLTHSNIRSNIEAINQVFQVNKKDVVMGILPFFHSFGYTGTLWLPLLSGMGAVYHNNPLDAKSIGKLIHKNKATLLMTTPTFLNSYTRRCEKHQLASLRFIVVGAEKLKKEIADAFKEKFDITPMEGYGCTELSPIVALNFPDYVSEGVHQKAYKPGTIGLPLPGIAIKVINQNTMKEASADEDGLLYIKGPNVMKGYLNKEELTKEVIENGWYKTGDIANVDEDGFIKITGRLSRFSKIGGEMVPHIKIEQTIHSILNSSDQVCVVTSIPDDKKGEKLAVLCLQDVDIASLVDQLKESDLPNLWVPDVRCFFKVEAIPLLGSGKLDLGKIKKRALEESKKVS